MAAAGAAQKFKVARAIFQLRGLQSATAHEKNPDSGLMVLHRGGVSVLAAFKAHAQVTTLTKVAKQRALHSLLQAQD